MSKDKTLTNPLEDPTPNLLTQFLTSFLANLLTTPISLVIVIILVIFFNLKLHLAAILFYGILSFTALLWNRIHNWSIFIFQCIFSGFLIWFGIQVIASLIYGLQTPISNINGNNSFSNSMEFLTMLPIISTLLVSILVPIFQLFSNVLFTKLGFQPDYDKSLAAIYLKKRRQNRRKYHQEYIYYD